MADIDLPLLRCYRCLYEWVPRKRSVPACPRCRSKLYAIPKIRRVTLGDGLGIDEILAPKRREILRLAEKFGAKRVRVFGSVRRREARPDSDVDLLVDWKGTPPPLAPLELQIRLKEVIGRAVGVASEGTLPWSIRPQVLAEAIEL